MPCKNVMVTVLAIIVPILLCAGEGEKEAKQIKSMHTFTVPLQTILRQQLQHADKADITRIGVMSRLRSQGILEQHIDVAVQLHFDIDVGLLTEQMAQRCKNEDAIIDIVVSVDRISVRPSSENES